MRGNRGMTNHQRKGAISNAHVGREFEALAKKVLEKEGFPLESNFPLEIGWNTATRPHKFDLGSKEPPVIVECKTHTWTEGKRVPGAKLKNWSEAMLYFGLAPKNYKKIFFVLKDRRVEEGETLGAYYLRTHYHLIPEGVEFWEYETISGKVTVLKKHGGKNER